MKKTPASVLLSGFVALFLVPSPLLAQNVGLGSASRFAVLGATPNVTNTGPTLVIGDVGVWPALSITGFPPGSVIGTLHFGDAVAQQAQTDLTAAYNDALGRSCPALNNLTGMVLGSGGTVLSLVPGVYCFASTAQLTGNLVLNGAGVYIFQVGSGLTTASGSSITLTNGASACGVWFQVTSSATLGTTTSLAGNILALTSITLNTGASVNGRVLARNGTVTLDSNNVSACAGGPGPGIPGPIPIAGVPSLVPWGLAVLAVALSAAAFLALRRTL
jgi:Ice-binding-like